MKLLTLENQARRITTIDPNDIKEKEGRMDAVC